jgi:hypothetical protein
MEINQVMNNEEVSARAADLCRLIIASEFSFIASAK